MSSIGQTIRSGRKAKNLTQQEFADKLNISRSAVSNWEIERNYPDVKTIVAISNVLDISLDELLKGDEGLVENLAYESQLKITQGNRLKWLYVLTVLLLFFILLLGFMKFRKVDVSKEQQIASAKVINNELVLKFDLPAYRKISGYMLGNGKNPWEKDVTIMLELNYSDRKASEKELIVPLGITDSDNILGINIVNSRNEVIMTVPVESN